MADTSAASSAKVTRNSQVILTAPPTLAAMLSLVQPALERIPDDAAGVHLLVLVPDADTALGVAQAVLPAVGSAPTLIPITDAQRGKRVLALSPKALVGAPAELAGLLSSGLLKLESVSQVLLLQADLTLSLADEPAMTAVMTELPKDCARTVSMASETDAVSAFAKAYLKRPRRVGDDVVPERGSPVSVQYVLTSASTRASTLRRVLDAANAPSAIVVATDSGDLDQAHRALRALGYDGTTGDIIAVTGAVTTHSALRVLYDVPATRAELDAALGGSPVQVIAMVTPRQVAHLRSLLSGGSLTYFILPDTMSSAINRDGARMGELRKILADGVSARELAALEPLLDDNDALEIAAAALRLLEREREMAKALRIGVTTAQPKEVKRAIAASVQISDEELPVVPIESLAPATDAAPPARSRGAVPEFQVLWFNVGNDDGATASSFVGAITGETGLDRSVIGSIEVRDSHALVEVSGEHAERIVTAMNASSMRNRQVISRIDRAGPLRSSRPAAGAGARRGGDRPGAPRGGSGGGFSRDRGDRPSRPAFSRDERPARSGGFSRDDRPSRPSFSRDDRPARSGGFSRDDRPARPPREGGFSRDERPSRPSFSRDDRPARPAFPREDRPSRSPFSRDDRPARPSFSRDERPARPSFSRDDRPARPPFARDERPARGPRAGGGSFSRDDRPARGGGEGFSRGGRDGGAPGGRGFTRDRGDAPAAGGNDFAERAERLRNSRKPTRNED